MLVRGQDRSCKEPGVNVLVLTDALDAGGEIAKGFATHQSIHAANGLADYLSTVPHGRTVSANGAWCGRCNDYVTGLGSDYGEDFSPFCFCARRTKARFFSLESLKKRVSVCNACPSPCSALFVECFPR